MSVDSHLRRRLHTSRRQIVAGAGAAAASAAMAKPSFAQASARVVVVGGGFAGTTVARFLRREDPSIDVTLVEPGATYTSCPFSNLVLGGLRELADQRFSYEAVAAAGVSVVKDRASQIDPDTRTVQTDGGQTIAYDRLVLTPGVDLIFGGLEGYSRDAVETMPHAWKAGPQTALLRDQLEAMDDGGVVVIAAPASPYRCPPGPYERASMIAHYLKQNKPRSKVLILDAKERFSKQDLFEQAWAEHYGDMVEWVGVSLGGQVVAVDPGTREVHTDFDTVQADVANIVPPQRAAEIAQLAGVADASGWCPIDPLTFASTLQPDIHVLGDAAIANAMPKSAFSANSQGKVCARQIARSLRGEPPVETVLLNTCYSLVAPDHGISIAGVYRPGEGQIEPIEGAGGVSPLDASPEARRLEAVYGEDWFKAITTEVFG
ncbi:MAG: FCSD flavin-binding domain-containing protein [Geminicoccaceae bacterium]